MADLISQLADQIVSLINSRPQSPTKEEVEAVIAPIRVAMDAHILASYPIFTIPAPPEALKAIRPLPPRNDCQGEAVEVAKRLGFNPQRVFVEKGEAVKWWLSKIETAKPKA